MTDCTRCGAKLTADDERCEVCRFPLPVPPTGTANLENWMLCAECARSLEQWHGVTR